MTKISQYSTDVNITGNDKWIGSDAQNFLMTKNFTPNNLAGFFNQNNVIDIGTSIRYRYQTLLPGEAREQGTISFETEIGPQVNFSAITTFLLAKNTLKQNNVTNYLNFLVGSKVLISKASNINVFGYYTITSIEPYIPDPNFYVVELNFVAGNGFIYEDLDYLISLVDKSTGSGGGTSWGDITGDITNQTDLIDYLSEEYYPLSSNPAGYLVSADLSGYVPYTGATETLDMGENGVAAQNALGDYINLDGAGLYCFNASLVSTLIIGGDTIVIFDSAGTSSLNPSGLGLNGATISYSALFSGDAFLLPNKLGAGGTFAMLSDIPSYSVPTLEQVLAEGSTATDKTIELNSASSDDVIIIDAPSQTMGVVNTVTGNLSAMKSTFIEVNSLIGESFRILKDKIRRTIGGFYSDLVFTNPTANRTITFKDESGTVAYLSDIPTSSGGIPHGTASGTDTYAVTITGITSYADGDAYLIRFPNGNTTSATLNINSIGAVALYRNNDGPLIGGDILDGGEMLCIYNSTVGSFQCIGTSPNSLFAYVKNDDSVTITKGQAVYAFSGTGDRMTVKLANNSGDATSAQTVGLVLSTSIAAGQKGVIMMQGLLDGLSILPTSTWNDGDPVYLGATAGTITNVKPYAPNHLVYLGVVTTASNGSAGRLYVRVQNGYELDELHNVQAQTPTVNDILYYFGGSPGQWKTASIPTILGYTPQNKSLSAYTVIANNTNAPADGTDQIFKSIANQVYTGTPVWTGTTAPSGSTTHSYSWSQIGNLVTLRINLSYVNGGGALTAVTIPLPTDCPSPYVASGGAPSNNRVIAVGAGIMQTSFATSTVTTYVLLKTNSTNTGFDILAQRAAANYQVVTVMVTYLTT
jgi:hypothetical protein